MSDRPALRALAERAGILSQYRDIHGRYVETTDATREALLGAMRLDASTERAASEALASMEQAEHHRPFATSVVTTRGPERAPVLVETSLRHAGVWEWSVTVVSEGEETVQSEGETAVSVGDALVVTTPPIAFGYHDVALAVRHKADGVEHRGTQRHVVAPNVCTPVSARIGDARAFGVHTNLYSVRSETNWGAGDVFDLETVMRWVGGSGGDFVGVNPLHTLLNRGDDISPYRPLSRIFRNPLYLHAPHVTDFADCDEANRLCREDGYQQLLRQTRSAERVDYDGVRKLQKQVMGALHRHFTRHHATAETEPGTAYRTFLARHGLALHDFATFMAMVDHFAEGDWRRWPPEYRDPRSAATDRFRRDHGDRIDLHQWEQFEIERQMTRAAQRAELAGMRIGLYADLAIGSAPGGADHWSFSELFAEDAELGAPPDDYSIEGQNWALPPLDPLRLAEDGYRYWTLLIRSAMESAGAIRLDHVMGVARQFWIPRGQPASHGAYVQFPARDLLGILALESRRHGTIVVGEDLGTVPEGLREELERWNVLSTRVFYFERAPDGTFKTADAYPKAAIASATTHDHPPLAGFWTERDLELRRRAGTITTDDELGTARAERARDRSAIVQRLQAAGLLIGEPESIPMLTAAIHRFLAQTPCVLASASLDDVAGEQDPVNMPGVGLDRYASWSRRMHLSLNALFDSPEASSAIDALAFGRSS